MFWVCFWQHEVFLALCSLLTVLRGTYAVAWTELGLAMCEARTSPCTISPDPLLLKMNSFPSSNSLVGMWIAEVSHRYEYSRMLRNPFQPVLPKTMLTLFQHSKGFQISSVPFGIGSQRSPPMTSLCSTQKEKQTQVPTSNPLTHNLGN